MQKYFLLVGVAFFMDLQVSAVTTSHCPQRLTILSRDLKVTQSMNKIFSEIGEISDATHNGAIRESLKNTLATRSIERLWSLQEHGNGRCNYQDKDSIEKAELYTKGVKNILVHFNPFFNGSTTYEISF